MDSSSIPALIISTLAFAASAVGVFFTYKNMSHQRTHNIKSVLPILHVSQWDYEDKLSVKLKNSGLGVAIIDRFTVTDKSKTGAKPSIYLWLPQTLDADVNYSEYWTRDDDFAIRSGEEIELITIPIDDTNPAQCQVRQQLRAQLCTLIVNIEYSDVYQNVFSPKKWELSYFARTDNVNRANLSRFLRPEQRLP